MIEQFFAVTMTSVYHVTDKGDRGHFPTAKKIALSGKSVVPIGGKLQGGTLIAICCFLLSFIPEEFERRPENVSTRHWGDNSSMIVGLFVSRDKAMECFNHEDRQPRDQRWIDSTKEVLELMGDDHPAFVICRWHTLALLPTESAV